jgi:hypothetical protein
MLNGDLGEGVIEGSIAGAVVKEVSEGRDQILGELEGYFFDGRYVESWVH